MEDIEMICGTISDREMDELLTISDTEDPAMNPRNLVASAEKTSNSSTMESTVVPESPANRRLQEEEPPAPNNTVPINTQQQLNTKVCMKELQKELWTASPAEREHVVLLGDSNIRGIYKDLIWLLNDNSFIPY
jgi:hypothetical protein